MTPAANRKQGLSRAWGRLHQDIVRGEEPLAPAPAPAPIAEPERKTGAPAQVKTADRTDTRIVNLRLPREVHRDLKRLAAEEERTLRNLALEAITAYIQRRKTR